jgi:glycine dehydrogenase subunit 2
LKEASQKAVLNANYVMSMLKKYYNLPMDQVCKHEFVLSGLSDNENHTSTLDVAKRLLDYGYHPPTIYFPLIVSEAMMIEPTETESMETLDSFIEIMIKIASEAKEDPEMLKTAPHNTIVRRIDEAKAARSLILKWDGTIQ